MKILYIPVVILTVLLTRSSTSPIRNKLVSNSDGTVSEEGKLDKAFGPNRKNVMPKVALLGGQRQPDDKESYYILVVSVPDASTPRPALNNSFPDTSTQLSSVQSEGSNSNGDTDNSVGVNQNPLTDTSSLFSKIANILVHSINSNFSGIVDESFGNGVSRPIVNTVQTLLGDPQCNVIRRLLGQCRPEDNATESPQRTLLNYTAFGK